MLWTLAAAALLATDAKSATACSIDRPQLCSNTNRLVWEPAFRKALYRFLGPGRASLLYANGKIADQQFSVLGGPPDDAVRVAGLYRFSACRQHSCPEKGAVLLEPSGKIVATAILHSRIFDQPKPEVSLELDALSIYVRDPPTARALIEHLIAWAEAEELQDRVDFSSKRRLTSVRLYLVGKGAPRPLPASELGLSAP